MPKSKSYQVIIVPETHWDRAWYVPFEPFRIRLVRLMDRLLAGLRKDPRFTCFTLDGQTIVIEDYLQIRPDKRAEIEEMVQISREHGALGAKLTGGGGGGSMIALCPDSCEEVAAAIREAGYQAMEIEIGG